MESRSRPFRRDEIATSQEVPGPRHVVCYGRRVSIGTRRSLGLSEPRPIVKAIDGFGGIPVIDRTPRGKRQMNRKPE